MEKEKTILDRFLDLKKDLNDHSDHYLTDATIIAIIQAEELNYSNKVLDRIEGRLADISCNLSYRN